MAYKTSPKFVCVVGAPRCGTTTLSTLLRQHPEICFSVVKEPHFFSQHDLSQLPDDVAHDRIETEYLDRFFPHRDDRTECLAEGSVSYLYAAQQMGPILRRWPDARFIIAVRDPMEMLPSLHQRLLYQGDEVVTGFGEAWALGPSRQQGLNVPPSCVDARFLDYGEIGRLGKHVDRFIAAVGRERCMVVVFDDLAACPQDVYQEMLDFLELPHHSQTDFAPQRASNHFRSGALQRLLKRPPMIRNAHTRDSYRCRMKSPAATRSIAMRAVLAVRSRLLRWNTRAAPPNPIGFEVRKHIREAFLDDIEHLSGVIGRDLRHWLATDRGTIARPVRSEVKIPRGGEADIARGLLPLRREN